jgi:L-lactate dehydrogenase complex protein LldE
MIEQTDAVKHIRKRTLDLSEFLLDILHIERLDARFPHRVGLHQSCHGLRGLRLGTGSELAPNNDSKLKTLLCMVEGLELIPLDRPDECCGFGGTFAINEAAVSDKMGRDRIADHLRHGAEVITAGDMSCLMHLEGIIQRRELKIKVMHIAEILNTSQ